MNAPKIFDKNIMQEKWNRAKRADFLVFAANEMLQENIYDIARKFEKVFEINRFDETLPEQENKFDLVKSSLHLHYINDLLGVLIQAKDILCRDGFFVANLFGGGTLKELRTCFAEADANGLSPRISPMLDVRDAGMLLQRAGFNLPVAAREEIIVTYDDAFHLMHHLRKIGETNSLAKQRKNFTTKTFMNKVAEIYTQKFSDNEGRIIATYEIITMSGWKPDESQQKPLKRGTAKNSLIDALQ